MCTISMSQDMKDVFARRMAVREEAERTISELSLKLFDVIAEAHVPVETAERALDRAKMLVRTRTITGD